MIILYSSLYIRITSELYNNILIVNNILMLKQTRLKFTESNNNINRFIKNLCYFEELIIFYIIYN